MHPYGINFVILPFNIEKNDGSDWGKYRKVANIN